MQGKQCEAPWWRSVTADLALPSRKGEAARGACTLQQRRGCKVCELLRESA